MRDILSIVEKVEDTYTLNPHDSHINTNDKERAEMKKLLYMVMDIALTEKQRKVMKLYFDGKVMGEIADILGVSNQATHRLFKAGEKKLLKIKDYI